MVSIGQAISAFRTTNGGYDEIYRTRYVSSALPGIPAPAALGRHGSQPSAASRPSYPAATRGPLIVMRGPAEQGHLPAAQYFHGDSQGAHQLHPETARRLQQASGCRGGATARVAR